MSSLSPSQNGIFPFASSVMNKILRWRQGDEDETWKSRAFLTLEKKLKKKNDGSYEAFFFVALEQKSPDTQCVTLDRSQDGRLQVSHRKMLPHVMCCRIARWPDLQTHQELKSVDNCKYPGHQKLTKICINPYHYIRVDHPVYPPVLTPSVSNGPPPSSFLSSQSFESQTPPPGYYQDVEMDQTVGCHQHVPNIVEMSQNRNSNAWCRITYWELSSRVGEPLTPSSSEVTIDGLCDPTNLNQRFSLGSLSNINRNSVIELTRKAIGKGIRLEKKENEIWAENLSEKPVFIQSRNLNLEYSFQPLNVVRMAPNNRLKIFDFKYFEEFVRTSNTNYERVLSLNSFCSIKMSFVKGWGSVLGTQYQRQEVTSTPCWLDIVLYEPLAYLDTRLRELGSPSCRITSTS